VLISEARASKGRYIYKVHRASSTANKVSIVVYLVFFLVSSEKLTGGTKRIIRLVFVCS
jgi:hypothetical protein